MAQTELDMVIEDARKVLGDGATIEKPKADFDKINDAMKDALGKFKSTRDDLEARLMALEDGWSRWQNAVRQTAAQYGGETFGLDPKDKDDAKKIKQAQKLFTDFITHNQRMVDVNLKNLDELNKHLMHVADYKPSPPA